MEKRMLKRLSHTTKKPLSELELSELEELSVSAPEPALLEMAATYLQVVIQFSIYDFLSRVDRYKSEI